MEFVKNVLFDGIVILGLIAIMLFALWCIAELLNRIYRFSKYIIMYHEYKRNSDLYDLRNKVVISKSGIISYSCIGNLDEQEEILKKAISRVREEKALQEKYSINTKEDNSPQIPT